MNIGANLKEFRKQRGLTQNEVAELLGLKMGSYGQYEINKRQPRLQMLNDIAGIFNCTVNDLINGTFDNENITDDITDNIVGELTLMINLVENELLSNDICPNLTVYVKGKLDGLKLAMSMIVEGEY
ncbi:XRE family transcriptional regulator [Clostridium botulinum]|uniref:XRE family transcriptional regulator n=1 Tax=Clostridium botulinum TaxID=1491 RepID=A0A6M0SQ12_CLOBO|nr:XRE family transcriptional regulator [Clostridium botulinum]NFO58625.1 helix-turn-helix transcriptional regulator [Clostridium botulinum]